MIPQVKVQVQASVFDLLVAMNPTVGEIVEIGYGIAWNALMQHHQMDAVKAADSMREALDQILDQSRRIQIPMGVVPGGKLDS